MDTPPPIRILRAFSPETQTSQLRPKDPVSRAPTLLLTNDIRHNAVYHAMTCALTLVTSNEGPAGLHWAGALAEEAWYGPQGGEDKDWSTKQLERMKMAEEGFMGALREEGVSVVLWEGGRLDERFKGEANPWETGFYGEGDGDEEGKGSAWNEVFVSSFMVVALIEAKRYSPTCADRRDAYPRFIIELVLTLAHGLVYCFIKYLREHSPPNPLKQRLLPKGLDQMWDQAVFQGTLVSLKTPNHPLNNWQCGVLWFEKDIGAGDGRRGDNQGPLGARKVDFTKIILLFNRWDGTETDPLVDRSDLEWVPRFLKNIPLLEEEVER
ncbi:hypothetical protein B0J18DRAFT_458637, partial [Chaetomium sp. MPI-SDFR-AT-0129]